MEAVAYLATCASHRLAAMPSGATAAIFVPMGDGSDEIVPACRLTAAHYAAMMTVPFDIRDELADTVMEIPDDGKSEASAQSTRPGSPAPSPPSVPAAQPENGERPEADEGEALDKKDGEETEANKDEALDKKDGEETEANKDEALDKKDGEATEATEDVVTEAKDGEIEAKEDGEGTENKQPAKRRKEHDAQTGKADEPKKHKKKRRVNKEVVPETVEEEAEAEVQGDETKADEPKKKKRRRVKKEIVQKEAEDDDEAKADSEMGEFDDVVGRVQPPLKIPDVVLCRRCNEPMDESSFKVSGKVQGRWRCRLCNTRATQISRLESYKEFMRDIFPKFTEDEKQVFWQRVNIDGSSAALQTVIHEAKKKHVLEKSATSAGNYYPLSWYKQQGYNTKRIKKYCTDTQIHPVLGKTYKVVIHGSVETNAHITEENATFPSHGASSSTSAPPQVADEAASAAKQSIKEAKAAERARAVAMKKNQALATKLLGQLATITAKISPTTTSKVFKTLPGALTLKLTEVSKDIKDAKKTCELALNKGDELDANFQQQVKQLTDTANAQVTYLKAVMSAAAKL
jgi:chemotaxis protein histidine kinase CheA